MILSYGLFALVFAVMVVTSRFALAGLTMEPAHRESAVATLLVFPFAAAVLGWVFFRINLTPFEWAGGALILTGIAATTEVKGISWRTG